MPRHFCLAVRGLILIPLLSWLPCVRAAEESPSAQPKKPINAPDPQATVSQLRLPPGFKAEVFAAEPQMANPVSISIDERGRVYLVETYRRRGAVLDIRNLMSWLDDDLA